MESSCFCASFLVSLLNSVSHLAIAAVRVFAISFAGRFEGVTIVGVAEGFDDNVQMRDVKYYLPGLLDMPMNVDTHPFPVGSTRVIRLSFRDFACAVANASVVKILLKRLP